MTRSNVMTAFAPLRGSSIARSLGVRRGEMSESRAAQTRRVPSGNQQMQSLLQTKVLQAKLTVNQPGDRFEQEADRMADAVMRMPDQPWAQERISISQPPPIQRMCRECEEGSKSQPVAIQRTCANCEAERKHQPTLQAKAGTPSVTSMIASRIQSLQGGGQPLPVSARNFFEPRFGRDFSRVRVHTDVASTRSLQARAYTVGRHIVFGAGQYAPETSVGKRLLAHELTHVAQQGGSESRSVQSERSGSFPILQRTNESVIPQTADVVQRAGDPAAIPPGLRCPTDLTPGAPAGTSLLFPESGFTITPAHTAILTTFRATWLASGGTDNILVHGFASTDGDQGPNWTLSCDRAEAIQAELVRLGIPAVRVSVVAHGESTDFGASLSANRRAVVSTSSPGFLPVPLVGGTLTARDNFAGRNTTRFGIGEIIDLNFFSLPPRPAADFGGLQWFLISGGGTLVPGLVPTDGTATYTAPATAGAVQLELRVAAGATAGGVISTHTITIVIPSGVRMTAVPGTAPSFSPTGPIPAGTWGAGFQANPFIDPRDMSFRGVMFGEGTVIGIVTPAGSFLSFLAGSVHPVGGLVPGGGGNATTGTPVLGVDSIFSGSRGPARTIPIIGPICGTSDFLWAIPWEFSVAGGPRTPFATANHHVTSTFSCDATIEKGGAGPFCRRIDGSTC